MHRGTMGVRCQAFTAKTAPHSICMSHEMDVFLLSLNHSSLPCTIDDDDDDQVVEPHITV